MTLKVQYVPLNYVAQTWPLVERFIDDAFTKSTGDDYTLDQVRVFVSSGQWLLLIAIDEEGKIHGAATSSFINYPNDRVAFITSIGGKLISSQETFEQLKSILKANGATKIQGAARESIARLWRRFGFKERYITVETRI
jgi:hypothetical protein